jgi:hypothetical protein
MTLPAPARHRSPLVLIRELWAGTDEFGVAILLILATIIVVAVAQGRVGQLAGVALGGGTLLFVLHTASARPAVFRIALVVVTVAVLGAAVSVLLDTVYGPSAARFVGLLLAVVAPLVILGRILRSPTITVRMVFGALAIYLLAGLAYAYLYPLIAALEGVPFFVQTAEPASADYLYFSYVTQTTVGFGDFTAATSLGRMVAVSEALMGQLYLVSAVALLVGNIGRSTRARGGRGLGPLEPEPPTDGNEPGA